MEKTAFITGPTGFIGSHLLPALQEQGWRVKAFLHKSGLPEGFDCDVVRGDISDLRLLRDALKGTSVLFHLASALGGSIIHKEEFIRINAQGTRTVFEAAKAAGVEKIFHFSSAGVLGHVKENRAADEKHPTFPINTYDRSKLMGENTAMEFAENGMHIVVIRPGWVYGPGDKRTFKLIKAIAKKRFVLVTRGAARQTPVFINDLIQGTLLCLEKGRPGEIYHLAGKELLSVKEMVQTVAKACDVKIPKLFMPLFPIMIAAWGMGNFFKLFGKEAPLTMGRLAFFIHPKPIAIRKARTELNYQPQTDFLEGMQQTVKWYRKNDWL